MPGERPTSGRDVAARLPAGRGGVALPGAEALAALAGLVPAEVLACPSCAVRAPESAMRSVLLVVALMLAPFVLVGVGVWAARRAARDGAEERA